MQRRANIIHFLLIAFGILACAFAITIWLAPPAGHPPNIEEAHDTFIARYPAAAVNEIRIVEDEPLARSFEFDYRNKESGNLGQLSVRYVNRGDGKWEIQSELPAQLP